MKKYFSLLIIVIFCYFLFYSIADENKKSKKLEQANDKNEFPVPAPPFSEGIYPCSQCHNPEALEVNPNRRKLEMMHEDIKLKHAQENRWCLDCHSAYNRDYLHLANNDTVTFEKSYNLCGQCHGPKLRDWKKGVHGKRIGEWNGKKQYFLCVNCHNPHSPKFKKLKPKPAPIRPEKLR